MKMNQESNMELSLRDWLAREDFSKVELCMALKQALRYNMQRVPLGVRNGHMCYLVSKAPQARTLPFKTHR